MHALTSISLDECLEFIMVAQWSKWLWLKYLPDLNPLQVRQLEQIAGDRSTAHSSRWRNHQARVTLPKRGNSVADLLKVRAALGEYCLCVTVTLSISSQNNILYPSAKTIFQTLN
jgi:hypothetical protein